MPRENVPGLRGRPARIVAWVAVVLAFGVAGGVAWVRGIMLGLAPFDPNLVFLGRRSPAARRGSRGC